MHNYTDVNTLWLGAIAHVAHQGNLLQSRAGKCREVIGYAVKLQDPRAGMLAIPGRRLALNYAFAELLWYLSLHNDIAMLRPHAPSYERFTQDGVHANGAYGERWASNPGFRCSAYATRVALASQLHAAYVLLNEKPETRQAVVTMWDSGDLPDAMLGKMNDIPCTLSLQFMLRDGKLHLIATMRSNDMWLGMPYDIFCFTSVQRIMAAALGVGLGTYMHTVGSLHLYERNREKAMACLQENTPAAMPFCDEPSRDDAVGLLACPTASDVIEAEKQLRNAKVPGLLARESDDLLSVGLKVLAHKLLPDYNASALVPDNVAALLKPKG